MAQLSQLSPLVNLINKALEAEHLEQAAAVFLQMRPADRADVFELMDDSAQELLLTQLDIPNTADLFDELEDHETAEAAASLSLERLADVLDEMDPDEAADLLLDLSPEKAEQALIEMDEAEDVIPLLHYADETAGGRMTTAYIDLVPETTTEGAIQQLREMGGDNDVPFYLFVVTADGQLTGIVGLQDLVIASPETTVREIMDPDVIRIAAEADQEEAARIMVHYDLTALPVVDPADGHMLGVITHDDILDVIEDEATEDIYHLASVTNAELEPESAVNKQLKGRLPWLLLNTMTALFASWIISNFGDLFLQVAVLAFFQSVVAGQGGNAASQNVAMIVRALALGKIESKRVGVILLRQLWVGFLQGSILGIIVGGGVAFWQHNPYLGLVLGLALIGNLIVASIVGTLAPLALHFARQDPALASSVLVTAATDSLGFLIFLSLAKFFLPYLVHYIP
ncbi:MAG: magnesium transporter [Chloroflexota bacterium]